MEKMKRAIPILLAAVAAACGAERPELLVSTGWLADRLHDPSLVILHVGSRSDYDAGHVPGARLITLADVSMTGEGGLRLELPAQGALEAAFGKVGISDSSRVVIYAGTDSVSAATRVWFTLDYLGAGSRVSLLDGGLAAWRGEGRPLSTATPAVAPARFTARPQPDRLADASWIAARLKDPGMVLLDARTPDFHSGRNAGPMPRAGRIPGARNLPANDLIGPDRKLRPELLAQLAGPDAARQPVVIYCHIGQLATVLYFSARYLGLDARLYDGSFQDWSARADLPVEGNR